MFSGYFLVLLCLLLGGHLEARPLPIKQKTGTETAVWIKGRLHGSSLLRKSKEGIPLPLDTIPVSKQPFRVLLNQRKNRYRGDFLHPPDIYRESMMKGSISVPDEMPVKKQRVIIAHNLPIRFQNKEKLLEYKAPKRGIIKEGLSLLIKWILTGLGILAILLCLCMRFLKDMFDKHGDKIPFDKVIKMYSKPEEGE